MPRTVYFAHGKESGPWGTKIKALADVARERGHPVESPDYSSTMDPDERVQILLETGPPSGKDLILVGSSMGGYVSAVAAQTLRPAGLFLLAPAFFIEGYAVPCPEPAAGRTAIVHGWHDEIVPLEHSIRYGRKFPVELHVLDSDHRLTSRLPEIEALFRGFLDRISA